MRIFIGIRLPESAREYFAALSGKLQGTIPGHFVPPGNFHVTLRFIGDTDTDSLRKIHESVDAATRGHVPFAIKACRLSSFHRAGRHIVWVGFQASPPLDALHADMEGELAARGFPGDRQAFLPHVTLIREAYIKDTDILCQPLDHVVLVSGLTVFESVRTDSGLAYLPEYRRELKG